MEKSVLSWDPSSITGSLETVGLGETGLGQSPEQDTWGHSTVSAHELCGPQGSRWRWAGREVTYVGPGCSRSVC